MRWTRWWRTTSTSSKWQKRMPSTPSSTLRASKQAGLLGVGQVDLGEVAGDDGLGVVAEAGEEHLHLLVGGVLGLVHDDEGVVERAAAHEGQRRDLDDVGLQHLVDLDGSRRS